MKAREVSVNDSSDIVLRPAAPQDRFRIRRWLAEPEVAAAWGNAASAEAEVNLAMSSPAAVCRMIESGGEAIGYAHGADLALWGGDLQRELAPGTWKIDLLIASRPHRGLGATALSLLTGEVFATTLAVACCSLVSIKDEPAVRACEQAGFRWQRVWHDPLCGPTWLMLKERPS